MGQPDTRGRGGLRPLVKSTEEESKMARKAQGKRNAFGAGTIREKTVQRAGKAYTYWEARYTAGYDPGTGRQIQRSITGQSQREVAKKLREATLEVAQGTHQKPERITVGEWLDTWVREYLGNTKPHTRKSYRAIIKNHIKPAIGAVKLASLTPLQVQRLINGVRSTRLATLGQPVNPKTAKNVHGVLHSALKQAVLCGYIRGNPADRVVLPKRTKAEIHVLEDQQLSQFLKEIEGHPFQYLYQVDLLTGMRQSELLGLQWPDIDFVGKTLTVKRQLQYLGSANGGYQYATPKSNKPRLIALPDMAIDALKAQKALQEEMRRAVGEAWSNPDELVFTNPLGEHIKHDVIYRNLKRIFAKMGVPKLRFHDLRHSYAVMSLQSGCDIKTVQENMGHYAAAFTLDAYGHVTQQMRREGAEKINNFVEKLGSGAPVEGK